MINLVTKKDHHFTTQTFGWIHFFPLEKVWMTRLSLLRRMLGQTSDKFPEQQSYRAYLQNLYGTFIHVQVFKEYNLLVTRVTINTIKGSLVNTPTLEKEAINNLLDTIFKPIFILKHHRHAAQALFDQEKNRLRVDLKTKADEPSRFLAYEFYKMFGNHHHANIDTSGEIAELENVTLADIETAYQTWISYPGTFFYHGEMKEDNVKKMITDYPFLPEHSNHVIKTSATLSYEPLSNQTIKTKFNQTQMRMMYATEVKRLTKEAYALVVMNEMFGGDSESYLFQEVREKHQLCYQIGSHFIPDYGAISLVVGTHHQTLEKTTSLIEKQLLRLQHGDFSEDFFKRMKLSIIQSHRRAHDHPSYHVELIRSKILHDTTLNAFEYIEKIKTIERIDVMRVSQRLKLIKSLVLIGKN